LQVGDLTAGKAGREQRPDDDPAKLRELPLPLVWVHGNHEHWHALGYADATHGPAPNLPGRGGSGGAREEAGAAHPRPARPPAIGYHLWPGDEYVVPGTNIRIVGLPGNYAPTWYGQTKPFPGERVRHFNAVDVAALDQFERPSVLLMHEAFRGQAPGRIGQMGIPILATLVRRLRPRVCLTGHHHSFAATVRGATLAISLPRAQVAYVRLWFAPAGRHLDWELVPIAEGGATGEAHVPTGGDRAGLVGTARE
jgi:hypothetical protein